jgi:hypothetical protein
MKMYDEEVEVFTHSYPWHMMQMSGQVNAPTALYLITIGRGSRWVGGWGGDRNRANLDLAANGKYF